MTAERRDETPTAACFRQYNPPGRGPGICWVAELHLYDPRYAEAETIYPVAVAWLTDCGPSGFYLDFILVPDQHRRRGYAMELIRACEARWPDLVLTDAISEAGEGLLAAVEREASQAQAAAAGSGPEREP